MKRKGFRTCRKCRRQRRYPRDFARTRNGAIAQSCVDCAPSWRTCRKCGELRRAPDQIRPTGRTCADCQRKRRADYDRKYYNANRARVIARVSAWIERNRERHNEYTETAKQRILADPDRHALYLIRARMNNRLNGRVKNAQKVKAASDGWTQAPHGNHLGPILDAGPLAAWLRHEYSGWATKDIGRRLAVDDAQIGRLIRGEQQQISLHTADRIFVAADCTHLLALLYPEDR